jgi:hypothetical protein
VAFIYRDHCLGAPGITDFLSAVCLRHGQFVNSHRMTSVAELTVRREAARRHIDKSASVPRCCVCIVGLDNGHGTTTPTVVSRTPCSRYDVCLTVDLVDSSMGDAPLSSVDWPFRVATDRCFFVFRYRRRHQLERSGASSY